MASKQSQGIETLLQAEKDAAKIVQQARQYRIQKLKDAQTEASKEVDAYKKEKEAEFKAFEAKFLGSTEQSQVEIDKDTEVNLKDIETSFKKNKDAAVKKILDRVVLVKPELHRNLKKLGQ